MSFVLQPWFWTAFLSGLSLVGLFFFAYYVHDQKARLFNARLMPGFSGKSAPPRISDMAKWIQPKKRTFRMGNLLYVLLAAYFTRN